MTKSFLLGALTALAASPLILLALPESRPSPSTGAGTGCEGAQLESLMNRLAVAYPRGRLADLDGGKPSDARIQILVEHSLVGEMESEILPDFASVEKWLGARTPNDEPYNRSSRPLLACGKGLCTYDFFDGISHGTLHLHHVLYGCRAGKPFIRVLGLLDGD
jgi:hypothetical protein